MNGLREVAFDLPPGGGRGASRWKEARPSPKDQQEPNPEAGQGSGFSRLGWSAVL